MEAAISLWGDSIGKGVVFDEARGRYVILKDNCVRLLSERLGETIANHAVMGCTARRAMERMEESQLKAGGVAVLEFGGNDCDMPWRDISEAPGGEHLPNTSLADFRKALAGLVGRVKAAGMRPVLITPPPLIADRYFKWVSRNLNAEAILSYLGDVQFMYRWQERYAAAVRDVAQGTGAGLLDLRDVFLDHGAIGDYFCIDGIHPNERGHRLLYEAALDRMRGEIV